MGHSLSQNEVIDRLNNKYGDKYDYSSIKYSRVIDKVEIICKKHGVFLQTPKMLFKGMECQKCMDIRNSFWSKDEEYFLTENYKTLGAEKCAEILSRERSSVVCKASKIGASNKVEKQMYHEFISPSVWKSIENRAKKKNFDLNIDLDYIYETYLEQNKKCAISGQDIVFGRTKRDKKTASVDRIDSSKGYIKGNIQIVHKDYNILKWDKTEKELMEMCEKTLRHLKRRFSFIEIEEFSHLDAELPVRKYRDEPILQKHISNEGSIEEDLF